MKKVCREQWEALVDLAEGRVPPQSAPAHLATCSECQARLSELTRIFTAMSIPTYTTPAELKARAMGLMPKSRPAEPTPMRLLRTSFGLSGARSGGQGFQAVYGYNAQEVRMMYTLSDEGWEVTGRLPNPDWQAMRDGEIMPTDPDGRFFFVTKNLAHSAVTVVSPSAQLLVPAGSLVSGEESDGSRDRS